MAVWNGKLGAEVYDSMQLMYSAAPINFSCYFYDAVHAIAYAIDWNVLKGNDNEDKDILMD